MPEVARCKVAGIAALRTTMKIPLPPDGPATAHGRFMTKLLMGGNGDKTVAWLVPADEHTVLSGYVDTAALEGAIRAGKRGAPGLEKDAGVAETAALLPRGAAAVAYVSPTGTVEFLNRILPAAVPLVAYMNLKLPAFPKTPPIGFAATTALNELRTCLVVPAKVLYALPQYAARVRAVRSLQATSPGTAPPVREAAGWFPAPLVMPLPVAPPVRDAAPAAGGGKTAGTSDQAGPLTLDIARFCRPSRSLDACSGRKLIDGLPFEIRGQAGVWGQTTAERDQEHRFPQTLAGIRIGRTFNEPRSAPLRELARRGRADDRLHLFELRRRHEGRPSPLLRAHVRDRLFLPSFEKDAPTDPDSKLCWRGPVVVFKAPAQLYKTRLRNPFPQKVAETMDVISARSLATYTLVAATVADSDPSRSITPPPCPKGPKRKFDGRFTIHVVDDATGKPIPGALVQPSLDVLDEWVVGPPFFTTSAGRGIVRYPVKDTTRIAAWVSKAGYLPQTKDWSEKMPDSFAFRLTAINQSKER